MHANNEVGTIQPITQIATIARQHQIIFHTDAAQSVGKINTDVDKLGVDMLTIAGHKLYAPKGIGALYVKKGTAIGKILYGAGQENGLRPGTENVAYIVALGKACEMGKRNFDKNTFTMLSTKKRLINGLRNHLGDMIRVNAETVETLPNTLSIAFTNIESHTLASIIGNDVLISTGSACHADSIEISPVLKAMKVDLMTAASTVRISTGKHTSFEEIDRAIEVITEAIKKLS
jgi:cysteine desulfurase